MSQNVGKVIQIIGPVLDIQFEKGKVPNLLNAIEITHEGKKVVCEVATQVGDDVVRCIAMSSTDGMSRGMEAVDTGKGDRQYRKDIQRHRQRHHLPLCSRIFLYVELRDPRSSDHGP